VSLGRSRYYSDRAEISSRSTRSFGRTETPSHPRHRTVEALAEEPARRATRQANRARPARMAALRPRPLAAAWPRSTNRPQPVDRPVTA